MKSANPKRSQKPRFHKPPQKKKTQSINNFKDWMNKTLYVRFGGGREVKGTLRGYDELGNIILGDAFQFLKVEGSLKPETRNLGLVFARGPNISEMWLEEGFQEIANPYT